MRRLTKNLVAAFLGILCILGANHFFNQGFTTLSEVRQLDRLPESPIKVLAGGPYTLQGTVNQANGLITAPYSDETGVYVRFRLEQEYRDSDGNRRTRTLESGVENTPFILTDDTGSVLVDPTLSTGRINWAIEQSYYYRDGDLIYREWVLLPGQQVKVAAIYRPQDEKLVFFENHFNFPAIVADRRLQVEGGKRLYNAGVSISVASALAALGIALFLIALRVHRFWVYVLGMTLVMLGYLSTTGLVHLERDWQRAAELYQSRLQAITQSEQTPEQWVDLLSMRLQIESGAAQWPDNQLFEPLAGSEFPIPQAISADFRREIEQQFRPSPTSQYSSGVFSALMILLGLMLCGAALYFGVRTIKLKRLIEHLPTTSANGLSFGLTELSGKIVVNDQHPSITSTLTQSPCVAYKYDVSERRGSGKKSSWVTLRSGEQATPFWLTDDSGQALVYPQNASIAYPEKYVRREGRKRYTEHWLPADKSIYCLGFAGLDPKQPDRLAVQKDEDNPYIITTATEQELVENKGALGFLLTALSLGLFLFAATTALAVSSQLTPSDLFITALLVPVFLMVYVMILHYNDLVFLRNRSDKAWSNISTVLQQRHDLWPRLQSTVEAYLDHERQLLEDITRIRNSKAHRSENADTISEHLVQENRTAKQLIARVEDYPDLKANTVVEQFMEQMEATEDYLSLLRNGYNDAVEIYNTRIQSLPDLVIAKLFRFKSKTMFIKD